LLSLSIPFPVPIQVFSRFLEGDSLASCYAAVAQVANNWLDVVDTRGEALDDAELIGLISENKTISGLVTDYGDQKITRASPPPRAWAST
jgi:DNA polymerase epsilon subunit 1